MAWLRGCLVYIFKQQFSVFKQHFTHFNALFHPHVFPQIFLNNNFQFLNTYTKRALNFASLFYYLAYFCYYLWIPLHFLILFISLIILFQLIFIFIYSIFKKKYSVLSWSQIWCAGWDMRCHYHIHSCHAWVVWCTQNSTQWPLSFFLSFSHLSP